MSSVGHVRFSRNGVSRPARQTQPLFNSQYQLFRSGLSVAKNIAELYRFVLVDTPLAAYFQGTLSEEDLDELNVEIIRYSSIINSIIIENNLSLLVIHCIERISKIFINFARKLAARRGTL